MAQRQLLALLIMAFAAIAPAYAQSSSPETASATVLTGFKQPSESTVVFSTDGGAPKTAEWKSSGMKIDVTVPYLSYWTMIVIE